MIIDGCVVKSKNEYPLYKYLENVSSVVDRFAPNIKPEQMINKFLNWILCTI